MDESITTPVAGRALESKSGCMREALKLPAGAVIHSIRRGFGARLDAAGGDALTKAPRSPGAGVAELVDARDLKSLGPQGLCGFDSRPPHQLFRI